MKKTLAYLTTAILMGFAVMMLPLALETGPPTYAPQPQFLQPLARSQSAENMSGNNDMTKTYGISQPLDLLPSSLVLVSGLIVAIAAYAILRRRTF